MKVPLGYSMGCVKVLWVYFCECLRSLEQVHGMRGIRVHPCDCLSFCFLLPVLARLAATLFLLLAFLFFLAESLRNIWIIDSSTTLGRGVITSKASV